MKIWRNRAIDTPERIKKVIKERAIKLIVMLHKKFKYLSSLPFHYVAVINCRRSHYDERRDHIAAKNNAHENNHGCFCSIARQFRDLLMVVLVVNHVCPHQ